MVNQQGSPFYAEDASAMQRSHKRIVSHLPHQPGVSGPHPHLCRRLLAVRLCQQEVPPHRRSGPPTHGRRSICSTPLLYRPAPRRSLLPAGIPRGDAAARWSEPNDPPNIETFIGCDSSYRARRHRALRRTFRLHHQLPPRRTVRPVGHPARELWPGDVQPLPERRSDRLRHLRQRRPRALLRLQRSCPRRHRGPGGRRSCTTASFRSCWAVSIW